LAIVPEEPPTAESAEELSTKIEDPESQRAISTRKSSVTPSVEPEEPESKLRDLAKLKDAEEKLALLDPKSAAPSEEPERKPDEFDPEIHVMCRSVSYNIIKEIS
jgi:hypothetical protein